MLDTPSSSPLKPPTGQAPRQWPRLAMLTLGVVLGHGLLLFAPPEGWVAHAEPSATVIRPFTTRTIPVTAPSTATDTPPQDNKRRSELAADQPSEAPKPSTPAPKPAQKLKRISAELHIQIAQDATQLIAKETPADESVVLLALAPPVARVEATTAMLASPTSDLAYAIPESARLSYDVKLEIKGIPLSAKGELLWQHDGKTYDARLEYKHVLLGSRVQTSTGQLTAQGLEPIRFGDKVRSEVAAHFERSKNKVTFSANTPDAPLLPGAQDQLSVFMQLAAMLGGGANRFTAGTHIPFQAIGPRSSETWVFKVGALETLMLPAGTVQALKLTRDAAGEHDSKGEIWFAPEMGYLPVRIRLSQVNGDFVEQQWRGTQKP